MASLATITALVVEQTRRPEVGNVTLAAIKSAVLRAHHTDFFPKDLATVTLPYTIPTNSPVYMDFSSISNTAVSNRSLKAVYGVDPITLRHQEKLEYRELDDLYDRDNVMRPSVYSLIGDTLRIYPQVWTGALEIIYYKNPAFTDVDVTSWIVDMYPNEIANWAAGIVFARTGFAEMARDFQDTHVKPFKEMLIASHLLGNVN